MILDRKDTDEVSPKVVPAYRARLREGEPGQSPTDSLSPGDRTESPEDQGNWSSQAEHLGGESHRGNPRDLQSVHSNTDQCVSMRKRPESG